MPYKTSWGRKLFLTFNYTFLFVASLLCLLPLLHVFAISFSSPSAAASGDVQIWPIDWNFDSYWHVLAKKEFTLAFWVSIKRVILGTLVNTILTFLAAYPLSKESRHFRWRTVYVWFFVLTMLFSGGLIPWYVTIQSTGLIDTIWALILPNAVPVFNVILLLNFFRGLPKELEESAKIDGAGHFVILWKIYIPLSVAAVATITLFAMVGHWNSWFDGIVLMNRPEHYPLQSYLQTVVIQQDLTQLTSEEVERLARLSDRTNRAAQIMIAALPILLVYPFLQRYFIKGITLGSVKE